MPRRDLTETETLDKITDETADIRQTLTNLTILVMDYDSFENTDYHSEKMRAWLSIAQRSLSEIIEIATIAKAIKRKASKSNASR